MTETFEAAKEPVMTAVEAAVEAAGEQFVHHTPTGPIITPQALNVCVSNTGLMSLRALPTPLAPVGISVLLGEAESVRGLLKVLAATLEVVESGAES